MSESPEKKHIAKRLDADGNAQFGPNWETLIERQIREAMDTGKFDDLPKHGKPLSVDENPYAGDMALGYHVLKNAGVAPPWIEADKYVRELLAKLDAVVKRAGSGRAPTSMARERDRRAIRDLVANANGAIAKVNAVSPASAPHRRRLDLDAELARYEAACRR